MPKLDQRLIAVTRQIRSGVHADIGSDHGLLLASLLGSGRIDYGIAIENKQQPWENSRTTLTGLAAEARFGDGLEALNVGEADSLSICGMGAENMIAILERYPDRIPAKLVLQPNSRAELVRQWAWDSRFWLVAEQVVRTTGKYSILSFERAPLEGELGDPAYADIDRDCGFAFGPLMLKEVNPALVADLREEELWWSQFSKLQRQAEHRLKLIQKVLPRLENRSDDLYREIHE